MESPTYLLKSARLILGMTQTQVVEGIATLSLYSKFETQEAYSNRVRLSLLCERLGIEIDLLQAANDHYRAIDRQIRDASRRQDFKSILRLCMQAMEGELTETARRRYLDKARIAWSLGGGYEVIQVVGDVTY